MDTISTNVFAVELFFFIVLTLYFKLNLGFISYFRNKSIYFSTISLYTFFSFVFSNGLFKSVKFFTKIVLNLFFRHVDKYLKFRYNFSNSTVISTFKIVDLDENYSLLDTNEKYNGAEFEKKNSEWFSKFNKVVGLTHKDIIKKRNIIIDSTGTFFNDCNPEVIQNENKINFVVNKSNTTLTRVATNMLNIFFFFFDLSVCIVVNFVYISVLIT